MSDSLGGVTQYAYDEEGNRTASHLSVLYASNDHNQLLEDDEYTYTYDAKGNRISKTAKVGGAVEAYSYDSQNRLVGYRSPTTAASYAYDALERRIAKTVDEVGTAYVYDMSTDKLFAKDDITLEFETGPLQLLKRRWAHSNAVDEPIGFEEYTVAGPAGTGSERLMSADRQGSILWVTAPISNDIVAAYEYDGYGQTTQTQGTLVQPYGYTGREYDPETGLYYYRARYLDTSTGLFMQSDPLAFEAETLNIYAYVSNNPIYYTDPLGLFARPPIGSPLHAEVTPLLTQAVSHPTSALVSIGGSTVQLGAKLGAVLAALSVSSDTKIDQIDEKDFDDSDDCYEKYVICQGIKSMARLSGNVDGTSRCQDCFDACRRTGTWPLRIKTAKGNGYARCVPKNGGGGL